MFITVEELDFKNIYFNIILLIIVYFYCHFKLNYWSRRNIQQLYKPNLIFGNFKNGILFRTSPGYHLGELYREAPKDAPYVGFYIFHKPCLLLKDPKVIKQMLIRDFDKFSDRHFAGSQQKDSLGMINLFGLNNPAWRFLRRKISPSFTRTKLKQMLPLMIETGKPMMNYLRKECNGCIAFGVIDAQDMNFKYTADLIANVALGTKTDSFKNPELDYTKSVLDFFIGFKREVALLTVFFMPELLNVIGTSILLNSDFVRKLFWNAVKIREKNGKKRGDFIDAIIQLKKEDQNPLYRFEGENLLYQSGMFLSGFESDSITTTFTLMELAKHKACQERARDEIKNAVKSYGWTFEAFNEMKYLYQCIAESLRLHPPVSTIDRKALQDYKVNMSRLSIRAPSLHFPDHNYLDVEICEHRY